MPGAFLHTPQQVVQQLLVDRGLCTDPVYWETHRPGDDLTGAHDWPAFRNVMPDAPDNCVRVKRTADRPDVRILSTGQNVKHFGIQVELRGATDDVGGLKALQLELALTEQLNDQTVTLDSQQYLVQSFPQVAATPGYKTDVGSQRTLYSLNCLAVIIPHPIQG